MSVNAVGRALLASGLASIGVTAVLAVSAPASSNLGKCPSGEAEDLFTGVCVPELSPSQVQMTTAEFGGLPEIDGVPCTGHNSYECIGLAEEQNAQGPTPAAKATVSTSASPAEVP
jgi:hypothetical protein